MFIYNKYSGMYIKQGTDIHKHIERRIYRHAIYKRIYRYILMVLIYISIIAIYIGLYICSMAI